MDELPQPDFDAMVLGETEAPVVVEDREAVRRAAVALARQARRSLDILTLDLEPGVYDDADFVEAAKQLAVGGRSARIRVLVRDITRPVKQGHRLMTLARRLTTFFEVRVTAREHDPYTAAFLVADETGTVLRTLADEYRGTVSFRNRREAGELTRQFEEMWAVAGRDPNLRNLHL